MTNPNTTRDDMAVKLGKILNPSRLKPDEIAPVATALIDMLASVLSRSPATHAGGGGDVAHAVSNRVLARLFQERLQVGELLELSSPQHGEVAGNA